MQGFPRLLNDMLMQIYHNIIRIEEEFLQTNGKINLNIREMHLIECVGDGEAAGKTLSEIAGYLKVARPSATVGVKKLEKRGYLNKSGSDEDGRVVHITLTREGRKVYLYHKKYHMDMVSEISGDFSEEEQDMLLRVMEKLNKFFSRDVEAMA